MYSEARKLRLVEKLLKIKDEALLAKIENLLKREKAVSPSNNKTLKYKPSDYAGCISKNEAIRFLNEINQSRNEWERDI